MTRPYLGIIFGGGVAAVLSLISLVLVWKGANDEPYETFRSSDAFEQVVLGTALITLWFCYSLAVIALVAAGQMSRRWLAMLLWSAICVFYLLSCPFGYLYDLEHIILKHPSL
jgi:hypothetical protein